MSNIRPLTVDYLETDPAFNELTRAYYSECNKTLPKSNLNWEQYKQLEAIGCFFCAGAFDKNNHLVGVVGLTVAKIPHYKDFPIATTESLFVSKEARGQGYGFELLKWAKEKAVEKGAPGLYFSAQAGTKLENLGYRYGKHTNTIFYLPGEDK